MIIILTVYSKSSTTWKVSLEDAKAAEKEKFISVLF
jgi:hypothetical protein